MERNLTFSSLGDAFDALPESVREHSLRVEKYADLIFLELCAAEEYTLNMNSRVRLRSENRSLVRLAARYHDLGKVLVPEIYQWNDPDFSPEELALYRRHCNAGAELVHDILGEQNKVAPMMVEITVESILNHHERWDGEGYPRGLAGEHIPVVGRIVSVADELDRRLMNTRTETPVQTAIETMMRHSAARFDPIIMGLLYEAKFKIEKIFALYRSESKAVVQVPKVIKRRPKRPMWLRYRPIVDMRTNEIVAVESDMQFKRGKLTLPYKDVDEVLRRGKLVWDAGFGFVVEACDMAKRMEACEIGGAYVLLPTVPSFLKKRGAANTVAKMIADTDNTPSRLALQLNAEDVIAPTATLIENCRKLSELGCILACEGVPLTKLTPEMLKTVSVKLLKLSCEDAEGIKENDSKVAEILEMGVSVIGNNIDKHRLKNVLLENGVTLVTGDLVGEFISEDEFISGELALSVN